MLKVEVADTPEKLARGLMYRDKLGENEGMLFVFSSAMTLSFWGRNTFLPLDIAFVTKEGRIAEVKKIRKLSEVSVRSSVPCLMAIEANEGYFERNGIGPGDSVLARPDDSGRAVVSFDSSTRVKTAQAKPQKAPKIHQMLPFSSGTDEPPMPDWMQEARDFLPSRQKSQTLNYKPSQPTGYFGGLQNGNPMENEEQDDSGLPELDLSRIMFADDDDHAIDGDPDSLDNQQMGGPGEKPPINKDDALQQQEEDAQQEAPPTPPLEKLPDARKMSMVQALDFAEKNGLVLWIDYVTSPKKKTIGRRKPVRRLHRIVQPHGRFMAKTTGNNVEVVYDMSVNDIRAFIISQITNKGFTGQTFKKWFRVKH